MEERERQCNGEERSDVESPTGQSAMAGEQSRASTWRNGQCVASVSTSSWFTPTFDFSHCRNLLETNGFQFPADDFEGPLHLALDHPSVKRYLLFNSSVFNFILAPFLYLVLWCAVYSTIHMYLEDSTAEFWVLCLCVSLVSIILTATIILIFHYSNKEINMNTDVRLVGVNEHMVRHGLLLGVANWVHKCRGNLQLFCVYWNMTPCLNCLVETLDNMSFVRDQVQSKLKKRMSHLVLVTQVTTLDPEGGLPDEEVPEEERPLQLMMIYSALYVRLLVSNKLPAPSQRPSGAGKNHSTSSLCLCEYVELKVHLRFQLMTGIIIAVTAPSFSFKRSVNPA